MWEQGLGSIHVDLGGIDISSSAIWNSVSISGDLIKNTVSCFKISFWSIIPGKNSNF